MPQAFVTLMDLTLDATAAINTFLTSEHDGLTQPRTLDSWDIRRVGQITLNSDLDVI